jgi:hypothetical protein
LSVWEFVQNYKTVKLAPTIRNSCVLTATIGALSVFQMPMTNGCGTGTQKEKKKNWQKK